MFPIIDRLIGESLALLAPQLDDSRRDCRWMQKADSEETADVCIKLLKGMGLTVSRP